MEMIRACEFALMVEANKEAKRIADFIAEQKRKEETFKYCEDVLVPLFMEKAKKALDNNKISFSTPLMKSVVNSAPSFETDDLVLFHGSIDNTAHTSADYSFRYRRGYKYWEYSIDTSVPYKIAYIKEYFTKYGYDISFTPSSNLVKQNLGRDNDYIYNAIITLIPNCENCE